MCSAAVPSAWGPGSRPERKTRGDAAQLLPSRARLRLSGHGRIKDGQMVCAASRLPTIFSQKGTTGRPILCNDLRIPELADHSLTKFRIIPELSQSVAACLIAD